jgi:hypothetical protein
MVKEGVAVVGAIQVTHYLPGIFVQVDSLVAGAGDGRPRALRSALGLEARQRPNQRALSNGKRYGCGRVRNSTAPKL